MQLEQLRAFRAVVKKGGFERAMESIHLSQPAISIRVKELEKQLGADLFKRSGRKIDLTDAGRIVSEYTDRVMIVLDEMALALDELKGFKRGLLRCGATTTIAVHLLPKLLVQFKTEFPKVEIKVVVEKTAEIEKQILADELDIGMVSGTITNPPAFNIFHYLTDELVLIAPRNHPLAKRPRVSLKQIAKFPLILRDKGSLPRLMIDEAFRAAGLSYNCMMVIETSEALKRAVAEGLGCSITPHCSIQLEKQTKALAYAKIAGSPMKREFRAIIHKDRKLLGPAKPFLDLLRAEATGGS
jgi:LysR family transcriptional regulator, transcriptional activator of the cysJI operon